jgi:hypothetical protein
MICYQDDICDLALQITHRVSKRRQLGIQRRIHVINRLFFFICTLNLEQLRAQRRQHSGMLRRVVSSKYTDVSEVRTASIITAFL